MIRNFLVFLSIALAFSYTSADMLTPNEANVSVAVHGVCHEGGNLYYFSWEDNTRVRYGNAADSYDGKGDFYPCGSSEQKAQQAEEIPPDECPVDLDPKLTVETTPLKPPKPPIVTEPPITPPPIEPPILFCRSDFNKDNVVNVEDFNLFVSNFGSENIIFDLSNNNIVDVADFMIFLKTFGFTSEQCN